MKVVIGCVVLLLNACQVSQQIFVNIGSKGLRGSEFIIDRSMESQSFIDDLNDLESKVIIRPRRVEMSKLKDIHCL